MEIKQKDIDRFWSKVDVDLNNNSCWEWTAAKIGDGYGKMLIDGKFYLAHRLSYMLTRGDIPEGMFVCHRCDNPPCVNPNHLFTGTNEDNVRDRDEKGRTASGTRNGNSKLTKDEVLAIRELGRQGDHSNAEIGQQYGVDGSYVSALIHRRYWKHI